MPVSPPVIKTTWVFIEFLLETLHGQFLGLLIEQTITFAVARSSVLRTKDHQLPCSPMGNAYCSCDSDSLGAPKHPPAAIEIEVPSETMSTPSRPVANSTRASSHPEYSQ